MTRSLVSTFSALSFVLALMFSSAGNRETAVTALP